MPKTAEKKTQKKKLHQVEYVRPPLTSYQISAFFHKERYGEIEASTKSGKTHAGIAWLFEEAAIGGAPGRNYWWVAPSYAQTEIAYRRLKLALPDKFCKFNDTSLTVTLPNGARIWFKSGEKPDSLYGEDVYAAIIDEASRLRADAFYALRSTLTKTQGKIRMIGNVKGRRNWFYAMCRKAEAGEPGHVYTKITASDAVTAGILSKEEIEDAKRTMPENIFRELFLAEPSDDGGNPFGQTHIQACIAPMSSNSPVVFGVDLAKSVDWTVIIGLDSNGIVCHFSRFQAPWQETILRIRNEVGVTKTRVDSTGVGDPVLEALQRPGPTAGIDRENFEGVKFTAQSKQQMMEGLAVGIQNKTVHYPEGPIVSELDSYEYIYTRTGVHYDTAPGAHDDCVCALALAHGGMNSAADASWASWV